MPTWVKPLWCFAFIVNVVSIVWFLIGSTANFQRSLDLIATATLLFFWIPSIFLSLLSIALFLKGWTPSNNVARALFYFGVLLLLCFSVFLFKGVNTQGWLTERITSDSLKITSDLKYEYRIDLINLFQKNSQARLYVRNVSTGVESSIPVDIYTNKIFSIGIERGKGQLNNWVLMKPTDLPDRYYLSTTRELRIQEEQFKIDIGTGTSKRLK
ncbi:hypothetical protein EBB07_24755 [Paenibacillaceae bacterium]|nr:hypothetical protein EBB07_24755 [Paenibacillaceae bacterium]